VEATLTTAPPPCARMTGATAWRPVNAAVSVTSSVRVQASRAKRSIGPTLVAKALETRTSTRRKAATVRSTNPRTARPSPTSTASKTPAVAPATSRPRSRSTSATTMRAPSAANAGGVADRDPQQRAALGVERRLLERRGVHLAEALEALHLQRAAAPIPCGQQALLLRIVARPEDLLAGVDAVERRLRDVDVALADE